MSMHIDLSKKENTLTSLIFGSEELKHATTKDQVVSIIKKLVQDAGIAEQPGVVKVIRTLETKKDFMQAYRYIYDVALAGDNMKVISSKKRYN